MKFKVKVQEASVVELLFIGIDGDSADDVWETFDRLEHQPATAKVVSGNWEILSVEEAL